MHGASSTVKEYGNFMEDVIAEVFCVLKMLVRYGILFISSALDWRYCNESQVTVV